MKEVEKRHPNMAKAEAEAEEAAKKNSQKEDLKEEGLRETSGKNGQTDEKLTEGGSAAAAPAEGADDTNSADGVMDIEPAEEVTIDDFAKLQIQVGEIVSCEEVKKSKKLLCFQVKVRSRTRQIVSGIKKWYRPEEMPGKKALVITNLKPAKLAGLLSVGGYDPLCEGRCGESGPGQPGEAGQGRVAGTVKPELHQFEKSLQSVSCNIGRPLRRLFRFLKLTAGHNHTDFY